VDKQLHGRNFVQFRQSSSKKTRKTFLRRQRVCIWNLQRGQQ
jgi:hypothetical protein